MNTVETRAAVKWLVIAAALVAVIVALCGGAPAQSQAAPALKPTGVAAFTAWLTANGIRSFTADLSGYPGTPCGGYRADLKMAFVDDACIDRNTSNPAAHEWVRTHELGHAVDDVLGFPQGANLVGFERGAQCVATVILGWSYAPPGMDATGYWDCPADQADRTRTLMEAIGAW
jgi:hypothetical protein